MTPEEIDQAVAKGIISAEQAVALKAEAAVKDPGVQEEPFSFVDNFGALFVIVGLLILQGAPWLFSTVLSGIALPLVYAGFAAIYWSLAETFVRGRRRLPATVSALLFVYNGTIAVLHILGDAFGSGSSVSFLVSADNVVLLAIAAVLLAVALARFRLPLLVLGLALSIVAIAFALLNAPTLWIMGGCGVTLILIGIGLDLRDPTRTGPWHEWAMWLFVVGSPLSVHPLFVTVIRERLHGGFLRAPQDLRDAADFLSMQSGEISTIALIIGLAIVVSLVGLLLDRRSFVTSSLIYLASAIGYLLFRTVGDPISLLGIIPLMIGAYVILLGVLWQPIRRTVMSILPGQALLRHLPKSS